MDEPIKWDKSKKDKRDADRAAAAQKEKEKRVKAAIGMEYQRWRKSLPRKIKAGQSLAGAVKEFRTTVLNALAGQGLDDFMAYSEKLLDDCIPRAEDFQRQLDVAVHTPELVDKIMPNTFTDLQKQYEFHTEEEFMDIPNIARAASDQDCEGLYLGIEQNRIAILMGYISGLEKKRLEFKLIGYCQTVKGISKFPTVDEALKAYAATTAGEAAPEGDSSQPAPGSQPEPTPPGTTPAEGSAPPTP